MSDSKNVQIRPASHAVVTAGQDQLGEYRGLGVSRIDYKVCRQGPEGLLILENTLERKGGPSRHGHSAQDEWFYALKGDFVIEVGT